MTRDGGRRVARDVAAHDDGHVAGGRRRSEPASARRLDRNDERVVKRRRQRLAHLRAGERDGRVLVNFGGVVVASDPRRSRRRS